MMLGDIILMSMRKDIPFRTDLPLTLILSYLNMNTC